MNPLLDAAIRSSVVILAGLAAAALLRRRSAALRHWVLAAAIGAAAITPVLGLLVPAWGPSWRGATGTALPVETSETIVFRTAAANPAVVAADAGRQPAAAPTEGQPVFLLIWAGGFVVSLAIMAVGMARLHVLASSARSPGVLWLREAEALSRAYGLARPVEVRQSTHPSLLVAWGVRRPAILLPVSAGDWPLDRIRVVLAHELAHVRRGDWIAQISAELLRAVYWFNPLLLIACRRLRQTSEYACDDLVLGLGIHGTDYAAHLLDLARSFRAHGHPLLPAAAIARPSTLRRRIRAMLNTTLDRRPLTRPVQAFTVAAVLGLSLVVAGLGAQTFGSLSGTVLDQTGGFIPDVTLTITHEPSGARHEVRSDATGRFEFVGLPPGDYRLEAKPAGFMPLDETLTLATGQSLERTVSMRVGRLVETITVRSGTDAESAPAATSARRVQRATPEAMPACTPAVAGGRIVPPRKVKDVRPLIPEALAGPDLSATVVLEARIGIEGHVDDVQVVESAHPDLDASAIEAVRQWEFTRTLLNCVPIEVFMTVTVNFSHEG